MIIVQIVLFLLSTFALLTSYLVLRKCEEDLKTMHEAEDKIIQCFQDEKDLEKMVSAKIMSFVDTWNEVCGDNKETEVLD